jgi:hypothetical protein
MGDTSFFISIVVRRRLFGGGAYSETALIQRRRSNEQIRFTGWYPELVSVSALMTTTEGERVIMVMVTVL